jgi:hypothetical protein
MGNRSDDFNRADNASALGTPSDGGASWSALAGTWGIASNVAYKVNAGDAQEFAVLEASSANVEVQATISTLNSDSAPGIVVRAVDANNFWNAQITGSGLGATRVQLYKFSSGSPTSMGTSTAAVTAGDVIKVRASGNSIEVFNNGSSIIGPVTDSTHNTATKHGIQAYYAGSGGSGTQACRHDDFSITDLDASSWFARDRKRTYLSPWLRR